MQNFSYFSQKERQQMIDDYHSGMAVSNIAKKYGRKYYNVRDFLRSELDHVEMHRNKGGNSRKNFWDFDFFNKETPQSAYWAGFIMADGSINETDYSSCSLTISVHKKDKRLLERLCLDIKCDPSFIFGPSKNSTKVNIKLNHKNLLQSLPRWGIIPNKTYNFLEPSIEEKFLPHYLRGWFDGDGNISLSYCKERFRVTGNPDALKWYIEALKCIGYTGGYSFYQKHNKKWAKIDISGLNQLREIVGLLHSPACFCLERKWVDALEYLKNNPVQRCIICDTTLPRSNQSGYCTDHYGQSPQRIKQKSKYYGVPHEYCLVCENRLSRLNKTGYCTKHREQSPHRRNYKKSKY